MIIVGEMRQRAGPDFKNGSVGAFKDTQTSEIRQQFFEGCVQMWMDFDISDDGDLNNMSSEKVV